MIDQKTIEDIKAQNPGVQFHKGNISFSDVKGEPHNVEFVFRRPSVADMEAYNKQATKSPLASQQNLLVGLVVHPDPAEIARQLCDYPAAVADFVETQLAPFFGMAVASTSSPL